MFYKKTPCGTQREDRMIKYPANLVVIKKKGQFILDFYYFNDMKIRSYTMKKLIPKSPKQSQQNKVEVLGLSKQPQ